MDINKIGASTACLADYSLEEVCETIAGMGFQTVELTAYAGGRHSIGALAGFWFAQLTDAEKEHLRDTVKPFQHIAIHAPFVHVPLITYNDEIQRVAVKQVKDTIDATAYLRGSMTVIHMNPKPSFAVSEYFDEMVDVCRALGDYAAERNVLVGVETGFPPGVEDYIALIDSINHQAVGAAIDVGHVGDSVPAGLRNSTTGVQKFNDNLMEIISTLGNRVIHFHLHDVEASNWRDHRTIGTGIIDFNRLFSYLLASGYNQLMTLELEERNREEALLQSRGYIESIISKLKCK